MGNRPGLPVVTAGDSDGSTQAGDQYDAWHILQYARLRYPYKLAVIDCSPDARLYTYEQLHARSVHLARTLQQQGVHRGTRVGVLLRNCVEVIEAHFACAAIHAVVTNLNANLTSSELAFILADSGTEVIITSSNFAAVVSAAITNNHTGSTSDVRVHSIIWAGCGKQAADLPAIPGCAGLPFPPTGTTASASASADEYMTRQGLSAEDGFHMYYTSGTTGRPKGVVLSHRIVTLHAIGTIKGITS